MRRYLTIIFFCAIALTAMAITQQGVVRTIARQGVPSETLAGVIIRVRGQHNAAESTADGTFSLMLSNSQNGDAFVLSSVRLAGYELAEQELIGRQIACSDHVPMELLLVNREQLQREKEAIADKARQNVEIYYEQRLAELNQQLADGKLREQQYSEQVDALESRYEQFEPLIDLMAEQYARTDINRLDALSANINSAIEQGNLDMALDLIRQKGNLDAREQELRDQEKQNAEAQKVLEEATARLHAVQDETSRRKRELAADYYRIYSVFLSRFDNDSAAYYLCRRAALDTLNVDYQLQAGQFLKEIQVDYPAARMYLERALRLAQMQYEPISGQRATATHELASVLLRLGERQQAKALYETSLQIREQLQGKDSPAVAETLNNLAELYRAEGDLKTTLSLHERALKIRMKEFGVESVEVAESRSNIASCYYQQKKYKQALPLFQQAVAALERSADSQQRKLSTAYNNLAATYFQLGDMDNALSTFEKAYTLRLKILGEHHPLTQQTLQNINYIKQILK